MAQHRKGIITEGKRDKIGGNQRVGRSVVIATRVE